MKIAYITTYDVFDRASWPRQHLGLYGTGQKIAQTLESASFELEYFGPLERKRSPITRLKWLFYRNFLKKDYYSWSEPSVLKSYAKTVEKRLSKSTAEIILCPENAIPISQISTERPMVLWTDAAIGSLVDFYPHLSNLCKETRKNINTMESIALNKCDLIILTSEWAVQSAMDLYEIPAEKFKIIPRGSSQESNLSTTEIEEIISRKTPYPCKLLFVGVEWFRKGGPFAVEVARTLNQAGLETELIVVGCKPKFEEAVPEFVKIHGFIDRSTVHGKQQLESLLKLAHFLILPTLADTFGVVLSEANSFGLPCLASQVGGITTVIKDDKNGRVFPLDADVSAYCNYIMKYMKSYLDYQELAMSSFREFNSRLSWSVSQQNAKRFLTDLLR